MTNPEFSDEFDIYYNNITSNQAPGLNEYEKSVFLTEAQDEFVKSYFDPKSNKVQEGFDGSARRQIDFSMLVKTITGTEVTPSIKLHNALNSSYFALPDDILLYVNEFLDVTRNGHTSRLTVIPVDYQEYNRLMSKPFKRPLKNQAWRLISSGNIPTASTDTYTDYSTIAGLIKNFCFAESDITQAEIYNAIYGEKIQFVAPDSVNYHIYLCYKQGYLQEDLSTNSGMTDHDVIVDNTSKEAIQEHINKSITASTNLVELIPGPEDTIAEYIIRYISRPTPIILVDLDNEGVTIGGRTKKSSCMLDPIIHREILYRAVELAKAAYTGTLETSLALGVNSQTPLGMVTTNNK